MLILYLKPTNVENVHIGLAEIKQNRNKYGQ